MPRALPSKDFPRPGEDVAARRQKGELAVERSETERVRPGSRPSPSRLRRATSPERERLWQRRKVCGLTAGFFLPLTNKDETSPLCQGLHLRGRWHFAKRNDGRGSSRKQPSPSRLRRATSPERERLWQGRKVCSLTADFFWPLTSEDESYPLCQALTESSCKAEGTRQKIGWRIFASQSYAEYSAVLKNRVSRNIQSSSTASSTCTPWRSSAVRMAQDSPSAGALFSMHRVMTPWREAASTPREPVSGGTQT